MTTTKTLTVRADWLVMAATDLELSAEQSLKTWIILGQASRYCEDMGKARAMRHAATIKNIGERRRYLRAIGIEA
jgi:hypothetical protein